MPLYHVDSWPAVQNKVEFHIVIPLSAKYRKSHFNQRDPDAHVASRIVLTSLALSSRARCKSAALQPVDSGPLWKVNSQVVMGRGAPLTHPGQVRSSAVASQVPEWVCNFLGGHTW